jgi:hypothetical protein
MELSKLASRVATRFIKAQDDMPEHSAPAPQEHQALPMSKPGLNMVKHKLDAVNKAFGEGDTEAFGSALDDLHNSHKKSNH